MKSFSFLRVLCFGRPCKSLNRSVASNSNRRLLSSKCRGWFQNEPMYTLHTSGVFNILPAKQENTCIGYRNTKYHIKVNLVVVHCIQPMQYCRCIPLGSHYHAQYEWQGSVIASRVFATYRTNCNFAM